MAKKNSVRDILARKMSYHLFHGFGNYFRVRTEFMDLIFENDEYSDAVRKIVLRSLTDREWISDVFNSYCMFHFTEKSNPEIIMPKFWNKEVEERTGLLKNFQEIVTDESKKISLKEIDFKKYDNFDLESWDNSLMKEDLSKLKKFVNDVLLELDLAEIKSKANVNTGNLKVKAVDKGVYFDEIKSTLYIKGKPIKLKNLTDTYHIVRVIFNMGIDNKIFFSEIAERIDQSKEYSDKKIEDALRHLASRINKIGINDVFIITSQTVVVNPEYLT